MGYAFRFDFWADEMDGWMPWDMVPGCIEVGM